MIVICQKCHESFTPVIEREDRDSMNYNLSYMCPTDGCFQRTFIAHVMDPRLAEAKAKDQREEPA